ncbi:MAG: hypothetical protein IJF67_07865 [Clostridia bacterium]|nr:hypothetical protein [Clostridia bacterium]
MKKTYASVSALLLIALLASCGGGGTTAPEVSGDDTAPAETTSMFEADGIPAGTDFGGKTVNILYWLENADYSDEMNGDVVNDALYNRDLAVEQRLNVDIENIGESYTWGTRNEYLGKIRSSVQSGDNAYDIACGQYATLPGLITEGMFADLAARKYIDLEKPWWVGDLIEQTAIGGRLYLATGDITTKTIKTVCCLFANKRLWDEYGFEDPIAVVESGGWTLDYISGLIKNTYRDLNGNSTKDVGDQFGFMNYNANGIVAFANAFDIKVTTNNKDGYPELTFGTEKVHNAVTKLCSFLHEDQNVWADSDQGAYCYEIFSEGRCLMTTGFFEEAGTDYKEMVDNFTILPYPKYDEAQENYQSRLGESNTLFGITASCPDPDMAAAVMEALASESYRSVSPAYYEVAMKVKYSRDDETVQMLDMIREGVVFDFGALYGSAIGSSLYNSLKTSVSNNNPDWASTYAGVKEKTEAGIAAFIEAIEKLEH